MATRTKPLISAAALASAAAVAVVSPGVAPSLNLPTPSALSRAAYELTTFTDVLSVPGQVWTNVLFGNPIGGGGDIVQWGYALGPENYGPDWAEPQSQFGQYGYVNPWAAYCNYTCAQSGLTGAAYLFFDALINGEGTGYENSDNWKVGLVNYFFEPNSVFQLGSGSSPTLQFVSQGFSAASWYLLQGTIGQITPQVSVPLATAFWGPYSASVFFNFAASIAAQLLGAVPAVGPLLGNTLLAYLGDLSVEPGTDTYYQYGLSGPLNYLIDLANGSVPWPTKVPWYKIDPAPAATEVEAESSDVVAAEGTETEVESSASVSEASETESESHGSDASATEASETKIEAVESEAVETETETETETEAVATEFAESAPEVEAPKAETTVEVTATELAESAPVVAAPKRPRPVRDAVENVGKQISTAVANAKAAKAERVEARKAKAKAKAGAASAE